METITQENKELLLKDLCARLPYEVKVEYKGEEYDVLGIAHGRLVLCKPFMSYTLNECPRVEEVKPYLFPLSNMSEEQKQEFENTTIKDAMLTVWTTSSYDWLLKNNFDFRGLIPKGLAIDATGLNIY
jgi:hypothetical protein